MKLYSYIICRDYGFAPNPFNGYCTLATCKPRIRNAAQKGDWIIGTGAKTKHNISGHLLYAMCVTEKMTFDEYWNDIRFLLKRPHMNGSLKQAFGDNIYHREGSRRKWHQENSHHSHANGKINYNNLKRDTQSNSVLISEHFFYFGENHFALSPSFKQLCALTQGHKVNHDPLLVQKLISWLEEKCKLGMQGNPLQFSSFERYNGTKK